MYNVGTLQDPSLTLCHCFHTFYFYTSYLNHNTLLFNFFKHSCIFLIMRSFTISHILFISLCRSEFAQVLCWFSPKNASCSQFSQFVVCLGKKKNQSTLTGCIFFLSTLFLMENQCLFLSSFFTCNVYFLNCL